MNNSYYNVSHSRDYYKGKSVEFAGEWTSGVRYFNDEYLNSLVVYTEKDTTGNIIHSALLACKKTHIAAYNSSIPDSTNNQPHLIINDDLGTIGIEPNDYWIFISGSLTGTPGIPGKSTEVVNTYLEAVALANENNISKIVFVKEEKGIYIITDIGELKKIISTSDLLELAENKVDKELGKGLSTNDFSNTEKAKLKGIEDNAQRNIIEEIDLNGVKIDPIDKTISINTVGSINEQTGDITLRDNSETAWDVNLHMEDHQIQGKVVTPKSVGSETTPVYFNENGEITPINIDDEVTKNSNKLVTSGAIYRSLDLKQNQLIPGDNITIQNNVISATSELNLAKYAKTEDVEKKLSTKQDTLIPDNGIKIEENRISVTAITESEGQPTTSIWINPEENTEVELSYNRSQIDALVNSKQNILTAGKGIQIVGSTISSTVDSNPFITVSVLPSVGENGKIYLVPAETPENNNVADEWIWNNNSWERLGSARVDLSNCPKLMDLTAIIANETDHITEERFNELKGLLSSPNTIFTFNRGGVYYYSTSVDLSKISDAPSGTNYESIDNIVIYFPKKQDTDGVYGYKVVLSSGFNNASHDFWWSIYLTQNDFSVNTYNGAAAGLVPSPTQGFTKKYLNVNGSWTTVKSSELENDSRFVSESALSNVAKTGEYSDLINKPLIKSSQTPTNNEPLWINPNEDPEEVEVYNRSQVDALLNTKQDTLIPGSGIIIDGNVISSIGGGGGGGSIDLSTYAKKADVETALEGKQNVISDLANIREGAEKGKTALQSFTETDPIYLKDKPSIALKSELLDGNSLVHKEGSEDINGDKHFKFIRTNNFGICQQDNTNHSVYLSYMYEDNQYLPILHFSSEEDWLTILDNIADPVNDFHAANKHYVDTIVSNFIAEWEVTSYEEILENYNKGRHIYLSIYNGSDFVPLSHYETGYGFYFNYNGDIYLIAKAEEKKYQIELNYNFISLDRDQTVHGVKTFESSPIVPSPVNNNDAANKSYVDQIVSTKQDIISDINTIRTNAEKGATALQSYTETDPIYTADKPNLALKSEIPDISGLATKTEVAGKQDTIADLDTIRTNANKGATALQSESDPVYMADKPSIALKTAIVTETEGNASYAISPNVLTKLGTLASSVTLSLDTSKEESGVTNIYDIIFITPTNAPSITWPEGISWIGGSAPTIAGEKTYEISIMNNLAIYGEY